MLIPAFLLLLLFLLIASHLNLSKLMSDKIKQILPEMKLILGGGVWGGAGVGPDEVAMFV